MVMVKLTLIIDINGKKIELSESDAQELKAALDFLWQKTVEFSDSANPSITYCET